MGSRNVALLLKSGRTRLCLALVLAVSIPLLFFAWQHYWPVQSAAGWSFRVYRDGIPMVSALAVDAQKNLYVSQEHRQGKGVIFQLTPDGGRRDILTRLSKPDGMALYEGGIIASQEAGQTPMLRWREGRTETLPGGDNIEGIAIAGRKLFAVEDVKREGRLLEYDLEKKETRVLREGLEEPEGVAVCPDGGLYFTEKKDNAIKRYTPGPIDDVIVSGLRVPAFLMCDDEGLWITEDATHRARLLLRDASGEIRTILSHLRSPQTIISIAPDRFLIAEQGRGRILELIRQNHAK
ncbi:MAG: hypothetical protein LBI87_15910 [Candidatus Accumulibacter sp.]|jgi:hypothetical protein|nr:hypothetical protein [Accumulibacter sp.]